MAQADDAEKIELILWDAPAVVREYLETGDKTKRAAAGAAARAAGRDAARNFFPN